MEAAGAAATLEEFAATGTVRGVYAASTLTFAYGGQVLDLVFRQGFCEHLASADQPRPCTGRLGLLDDPDIEGAWIVAGAWSAQRATAARAAGMLGPRRRWTVHGRCLSRGSAMVTRLVMLLEARRTYERLLRDDVT